MTRETAFDIKSVRPWNITLLAAGVFLLAVINLVRGLQAVLQWDFLLSLITVSPLYLALSGFGWALAGFPVAWGLWQGYPWARRGVLLFIPVYVFFYWTDRLWLTNLTSQQSNWPFALGMSILVLVLTFWTVPDRMTRAFFGDTYDAKS